MRLPYCYEQNRTYTYAPYKICAKTVNMDKSIVPSSDLASLDCWDYTIELECLHGPQGILLLYMNWKIYVRAVITVFEYVILIIVFVRSYTS